MLARRCKRNQANSAIVFVSRSTEAISRPKAKGSIRVDQYWCHSTFFCGSKTAVKGATVETPGMRFVTIFCDDQKVIHFCKLLQV